MKKISICIILCMFMLLAGCMNMGNTPVPGEPIIEAFELGGCADASDGGEHHDECRIWTTDLCNMFQSQTAEKEFTVLFDGEEHTGTYWYSVVEQFNTVPVDYYQFEDGWFSVYSSDKRIASIAFYDVKEGNKGVDDCKDDAIRIAEQFIDVSEYSMEAKSDGIINSYKFHKSEFGYETCARLPVGISTSGKLVIFSEQMTKEFDDAFSKCANAEDIAKTLGSAQGEQTVADKVSQIYEKVEKQEVIKKLLVVTDSNEIGMVYIVDVEYLWGEDCMGSRVAILLTER